MDQRSEFWFTAKHILNHENEHPYTDDEINEIIKLLEIMSDMIFHNITHETI